MSRLTLGLNTSALTAQREQDRVATGLASVSRRLASGMRINSASDDAAGLAIASTLNSNARVYTQGIRNANDAISATAIAEGGLEQLSTILLRLKELATQSANGSYTTAQRGALHSEAAALTDEFNRITQSTEFNGLKLLDGSLGPTSIQIGYGTDGALQIDIGEALERVLGDGTFNSSTTIAGLSAGYSVDWGDVNGDGINDFVRSNGNTGSKEVHVMISSGNGSFTQTTIAGTAGDWAAAHAVTLGDLDNDGDLDMVWAGRSFAGQDGFSVYRNNGSGTFTLVTSFGTIGASSLEIEDLDNDGKKDIVFTKSGTASVEVIWGTGNIATLSSSTTTLVNASVGRYSFGDINGDGRLDIIGASGTTTRVFANSGNRTFSATSFSDTSMGNVRMGDVDYDGKLDLVGYAAGTGQVSIRKGLGDGTFATSTQIGMTSAESELGDVNGDGLVDIVGYLSSAVRIGINDGKGNFTLVAGPTGLASTVNRLADLTGDGVLDFFNSGQIYVGKSTRATTMQRLDLTTQANARESLSVIDRAETRVQNQLGVLGATTSRLGSSVRTLSALTENVRAAEGRILDADMAAESAEYVKLKIRQDITAAVQSQANQMPRLVLALLRD